MKKYLLFLLLAMLNIPYIAAQDKDKAKMMEDLQQFKIDYLAKEMQLSEKEKSEFTPLYKEFDKERREAGSEAWKFDREVKKKKDASESDYKKLSELQQKAREKDNEIVKKYDGKFEKFLSAKQIYTMHQGEEKFFEKMKEMRKKHHDGKYPHEKNGARNHEKKNRDHKDGAFSPDGYPPMPVDF